MRTQKLKSKHKDVRAFRVVGTDFMMLVGRYPREQEWFSFMDRAVYEVEIIPPPEPYVRVHFSKKNVYAKLDPEDRKLVPDDCGDGQLPLPFVETKRISRKQFAHMQRLGCKTFDKKPDGKLYTLVISSGLKIATVTEWCVENCHLRFNAQGQTITFESAVDAVAAKLKFS